MHGGTCPKGKKMYKAKAMPKKKNGMKKKGNGKKKKR